MTRTREVERSAAAASACTHATTHTMSCNKHSCKYLPECDQAHVHCQVATVKQGSATVRVPRMSHSRKFMHIAANYVCKMSDSYTKCTCTCDKQPPCCLAKNLVLKNAMLRGNSYSGVKDTHNCCDLCNAHPQCTSWELVQGKLTGGENVCMLKSGTPQYAKNPSYPTVTYVGTPSRVSVRAGQSSCEAPFYVERDPSLAGVIPGPGHLGGQATTGPHQLHPFAGVPHHKIEVATHQMEGTPVNGLPGQRWVEAQDKAKTGSALEWQRGRVDVRNQAQGHD